MYTQIQYLHHQFTIQRAHYRIQHYPRQPRTSTHYLILIPPLKVTLLLTLSHLSIIPSEELHNYTIRPEVFNRSRFFGLGFEGDVCAQHA